MKIVIFEALDGSRFDVESDCAAYEVLCGKVEQIMEPLKQIDIVGRQFYQHHPGIVRLVANSFTKLAVEATIPSRGSESWHPQGLVQRFIGDSSKTVLRKASYRIDCIDLETGREYEQPYFRLHPEEATEEITKA